MARTIFDTVIHLFLFYETSIWTSQKVEVILAQQEPNQIRLTRFLVKYEI
jgi:hypothetical protein